MERETFSFEAKAYDLCKENHSKLDQLKVAHTKETLALDGKVFDLQMSKKEIQTNKEKLEFENKKLLGKIIKLKGKLRAKLIEMVLNRILNSKEEVIGLQDEAANYISISMRRPLIKTDFYARG